MADDQQDNLEHPVCVIESIPVGGKHHIDREQIAAEKIPTPAHLRLYPELGRGAMGRVHPVTDRNLLRHMAMKRLDKDLAKEPMYRDGFIAEAQMTGQLEHPNIVPVHELALSDQGIPYFTMKLVDGIGLDEWMSDPARPPGSADRLEEGLEIFIKVCDAIAYAHHRGVIHRDLKPENVMLAAFGQVYVVDWGLSRLTKVRPASGERSQMEAPGPVGTPTHMPPEQARGNPQEMDDRSDIFGLGALLYQLISGRTPYGKFVGLDDHIAKAKAGKVVPIEAVTFGIGVPKRLRAIVTRALAPVPKDRYQRVIDLQEDVRGFLRGGLHLPTKVFTPGDLIIKEGDVGDTAYLIASGKCRAFRTVDGQQETLMEMEAGDIFGEMALLLAEPRAASVEAIDQATVLVLDKRTLDEGLGVDGWTSALVRALAQRFRDLEQQVRDSGMRRAPT